MGGRRGTLGPFCWLLPGDPPDPHSLSAARPSAAAQAGGPQTSFPCPWFPVGPLGSAATPSWSPRFLPSGDFLVLLSVPACTPVRRDFVKGGVRTHDTLRKPHHRLPKAPRTKSQPSRAAHPLTQRERHRAQWGLICLTHCCPQGPETGLAPTQRWLANLRYSEAAETRPAVPTLRLASPAPPGPACVLRPDLHPHHCWLWVSPTALPRNALN